MEKEEKDYLNTDNILKKLFNVRSYLNLVLLLVGSFLIFMLGLGSFTLVISFILVPLFFIVSPFHNAINVDLGFLSIKGPGESALLMIAGVILLATLLFFIDIVMEFLKKNFSLKLGEINIGNKEDKTENKDKEQKEKLKDMKRKVK